MNRALVVLLLSLLFSCDSKRPHIEKDYYENGKIKTEVPFSNGKPNGIGKKYFPNGRVYQMANFRNGVIEGKTEEYFENGKLRNEMNHFNGKLHGEMILYNEDGGIAGRSEWLNGKILKGITFDSGGDTLSHRVGKRVRTFSNTGELILIDCLEGKAGSNGAIRTIRFNEKSEIVKYQGPLTCLTKRDTMLLDARNPDWRKLKSNI